jgi:drug/metabolite transporter (DMT)-like permease
LNGYAIGLILTAACFHAVWNLLAKRASRSGAVFVWLFTACSSVILGPIAVAMVIFQQPELGWAAWIFMAGTALLHLLYFVVLQRGYAVGDLSVVYPLARGTGPALSTALAILILNEQPSGLAVAGVVLVVGGVFLLTFGSVAKTSGSSGLRPAILWGLLCGVCIASYSLWDKCAVSPDSIPPALEELFIEFGVQAKPVPPVLLELFGNFGVCLMLTPHALRRMETVRGVWRDHWREALGVAILAPASYILILTAMVFTPLSYVAPAREISILLGALLGARLLNERHTRRRLFAAGLMVVGVIALAFG